MGSAQSQETEASQVSVPLRDLAAHFLRHLELRLQLSGFLQIQDREAALPWQLRRVWQGS
jgi:hypothetical protein